MAKRSSIPHVVRQYMLEHDRFQYQHCGRSSIDVANGNSDDRPIVFFAESSCSRCF